jgi:hypothetical protein
MATISRRPDVVRRPNASLGTVGAISAWLRSHGLDPDEPVQLNTSLGFGWVPANQVTLTGDISQIPVVQG